MCHIVSNVVFYYFRLCDNQVKMSVRLHDKCGGRVTLSEGGTKARDGGGWGGDVFSSVPLQKLNNSRFVFRVEDGAVRSCYTLTSTSLLVKCKI